MAETTTQTSNCPPLSLADRLKIYAAQYLSGTQGGGGSGTSGTGTQGNGEEVITAQANGTPIETTDYFRFRALSTSDVVTVSFYGRIYRKDKTIVPFLHTLTTTSANTLYETTQQATEGYLLGAAASVPINSITAGVVNAVGEIGRIQGTTFTPHTLLFSGQLDDLTPLSDSAGSIAQPVTNGQFTQVTAAGPGTDLSVTITPGNGKVVRVTFANCTFTNSAVAGPRALGFRFRIGGQAMWRAQGGLPGANQIGLVQCALNSSGYLLVDTIAANGDLVQMALSDSLWFGQAFEFRCFYDTPLAGDALTNLFVSYEER